MRIDSHHHFWTLRRGDYRWLTPDLEPLYRDFGPSDLRPHLEATGVDATVLVQAADSERETEFLLDIAHSTDYVRGVVGWADMMRADFPERLAQLVTRGGGYLKGIRPMLQDLPDDDWVASASLDASFDAVVEQGLTFDALVRQKHLPHLLARLDRSPELRVVIDHAAKPEIFRGVFDAWYESMRVFAEHTGVFCKLSGLLTEAGPDWTLHSIGKYVQSVVALFGADRVMWGSDWPVLNLASDYPTWIDVAAKCLAGTAATDLQQIFGGTANRFYSLSMVKEVS